MSVVVVVLGNPNPKNEDKLKAYQAVAGSVIAKHGGQAIYRGQVISSLNNSHPWKISAAIRFPDEAAVRAWYEDPEYQKVIPLRSEGYSELEINLVKE